MQSSSNKSADDERGQIKGGICPECGSKLSGLMTLFKKKCSGCNNEYHWPLNKGQQPLIKGQR